MSMETKIYNQKGKETGSLTLPETLFGTPWNGDLVHQVYTSMMSDRRQPIAHAKMRGEVAGGGKKPWKQKGTGRARHGSIRSPLWPGGGVTHGPRNDKNYARKVNRSMKNKAFSAILSQKLREGEVLFVDELSLAKAKTQEAKEVLTALAGVKGFDSIMGKRTNAAYIALPAASAEVKRSFRNIRSVEIVETRNMNVADTLKYRTIIFVNPNESLKILETRNS